MIDRKKRDWTEEIAEGDEPYTNYAFFMASDFVDRIEEEIDRQKLSKGELAKRLGVSAARVSQILHDPGNLTLELIVRCARVLKMKVTLVTYSDGDPENKRGPIVPDVFLKCWDMASKPSTMFDIPPNPVRATSVNGKPRAKRKPATKKRKSA